ncbi:hypothetical protein [Aquimarina sediminis]|uniref:hypothetical protein n=1 Tax=Aquimarina sediminis TaxID=2070536 RepID=UPI000CA0137E|nr:hypothetical protein [Aquimarina sediminis]
MKTILYIQSVLDDITDQKCSVLKKEALTKGYYTVFCFASKHDIEEPIVVQNEFVLELESKIIEYSPELIVLHTGIAFRCYPAQILQSLTIIKFKYPEIKVIHEPIPLLDINFDRVSFFFDKKKESTRTEFLFWLLGDNEIFDKQEEYYKIWNLWNNQNQ